MTISMIRRASPVMRVMRVMLVMLLAGLVLCLGSCGKRKIAAPVEEGITMAVVGFTQPTETAQLMAGNIPPASEKVAAWQLSDLDAYLASKARKEYPGPATVKPCQESVRAAMESNKGSALEYWVRVGQCADVEYLLVPQVLFWNERVGGSMGVQEPAGVILDLYLVDVKGFGLVSRYHYDETQVALIDNLLTAGKFLSRGGQWVTAEELAQEAIDEGLKEMGL